LLDCFRSIKINVFDSKHQICFRSQAFNDVKTSTCYWFRYMFYMKKRCLNAFCVNKLNKYTRQSNETHIKHRKEWFAHHCTSNLQIDTTTWLDSLTCYDGVIFVYVYTSRVQSVHLMRQVTSYFIIMLFRLMRQSESENPFYS